MNGTKVAQTGGMGVYIKPIRQATEKLAYKTGEFLDDKISKELIRREKARRIKNRLHSRKAARKSAIHLGLSPVEDLETQIKSLLNERIISEIKRRKLTHTTVSDITLTSRPKITRIMNRNLHKVSIEFLLRILCTLGIRVVIHFET